METGGARVIAGGYFIVRPHPRAEWMSELLPDKVLSVSPCIADIGPGHDWAERTKKGRRWRRKEAGRLGIPAEQMEAVARWLENAYERGDVKWPNVVGTLAAARAFAEAFELRNRELVLLGIGLTETHAAEFLDEEDPSSVRQLIEEGTALAVPREPLGYEVLGLDDIYFHSWLCNSLERAASTDLGLRPNDRGFLGTPDEAERVAHWANVDEGTEEVFWQPWLIARCDWN